METMTTTNIMIGILTAMGFMLAIVGTIYLINRGIRRWMKRTGDDAAIEKKLDGGDTLHAEGILGRRHPEEGGIPLDQEKVPRERPYEKRNAEKRDRFLN